MIKEFPTRTILHNKEQKFRCLNDFIHLYEVRVTNHLENMNFSAHTLNVRNINNFLLFQDLDGHFLLSQLIDGQFDFPECSLSQSFLYIIYCILIKYLPIRFSSSSPFLFLSDININIITVLYIEMFNNYTGEKEYESCNIIVEATQATGPLLIGDFNSATDEETLQVHKIKTVITAAAGLEHLEIPEFVTHVVYPLKDAKSQNIRLYFDESYQTIDQNLQHGGVLVHCAAGVSRSATIVIAYLMRKNSLTFQAAIQVVRKQRSGVCPNLGFELQLKQYGSDLEKPVPSIKKNGSKRLADNINLQHDEQKIKKLQNYSLFSFEPVNSSKYSSKKKADPKKTVSKAFGHSRPKQKLRFQADETELFVSGKSAKRPTSQIKQGEKIKKASKHVMMQTWGISRQKAKQF